MNPPQGYPPPGNPQQGYAPPPGGGYGYPPGPPQPPQKKGKGCLIAALVTGGVVLLLGIVFVVLVWKAAQIAKEGMNAPGTAELRAAGCDVALVMDMSKLSSKFDAGAATASGAASTVIACQVSAGRTAPSCDEVAQTYVKAASPPGSFMAQVQTTGKPRPDCQKLYSSTGTLLRETH